MRYKDICKCLDALVAGARESRPDIAVIAGDIFHQARVWSDRGLKEQQTAVKFLRELSEVCPVVVMRGTPNHDSEEQFKTLDLYVGYTTDFNRATAQTAQEVTEEQVFQPERKSLAWAINNRLLNGYQFQYVEAYFLEPDISNPDDLYKLLTVCNNAGGLTPNKAKQIIFEAYGETAEDYEGDWGDTPLAYNKSQGGGMGFDLGQLTMSLQKQIEKAAGQHDDTVVAVMKEVKRLLLKMDKAA